ncbi:MAG: UDP-2,3-diacylglucosamine diphosphatase LpxI [Cyanobacteria bacterium SZAS-4]|nr:UDP-2,3-diacylglucosamine diphosphatase LpxI [Cyanobacteria bacterium SZAS-4]
MTGTSAINQKQESTTKGGILGLIAGDGTLPSLLAKSAKARGFKIVCLALTDEAYKNVEPNADVNIRIAPGQLGRNFKLLQQNKCDSAVFIGKVRKLNVLKNLHKFDWTAVRELSQLSNLNDDSIQVRMGELIEELGIKVLTQSEFLRELFPEVGVLTKRQPTAQEYVDIEYGKKMAKECARLDIGQTVVVRNRILLAVEAAEGTDEAIKRGVQLSRGSVVVVKVAKPGQDQRFDIPTVGMTTLESMKSEAGGGVLAVEAHETMVVDREAMVAYADSVGIAITAV